jgi:hypothetical protein
VPRRQTIARQSLCNLEPARATAGLNPGKRCGEGRSGRAPRRQEKAMNLQLLHSLSWQELPVLIFALLLALVFVLVIRQNQKDFLEIEAWLAEENPHG